MPDLKRSGIKNILYLLTKRPQSAKIYKRLFADMAQLVEQLIRNQQAAGSSPAISSRSNGEAICLSVFYLWRNYGSL